MVHSSSNLCWLAFPLLYVIIQFADGNPGYPHPKPHYSPQGSQPYLPAPTGKRPSCAGPTDTFCTKVDYYPTEVIEYLVKSYSFDFKTLLQDESTDSMMTSMIISNATVSQPSQHHAVVARPPYYNGPYANGKIEHDHWRSRYAPMPSRRQQSLQSNSRVTRQIENEEKLCPTTSSFITPRTAVNTRGNWMYVVNLDGEDQQNTQLVRTERCATTECSGLCQVPAGFSATCSQQFVQKRLVALNGNGENLYTDTFWFPHCCICQIRSSV
ncbi:hypothetical protein DAPPUDRAFT_309408 [Daphnia pulex]|uniref:Spaetzle domain-containing protein n=1 Tax=Daphnia pulex TaxID=6669 RepID=E9HCI7_DAPPU|nr:hypothetical protein DAPPUDRAFT_309408 [Daphnia pulex]|eukprot:EFX70522.1 hypothetical protein DAPPUDRAFT_309408 [Daphnia pulex]